MVGFVVVDELLVFIAAVLGEYHWSGGMGLVYIGRHCSGWSWEASSFSCATVYREK